MNAAQEVLEKRIGTRVKQAGIGFAYLQQISYSRFSQFPRCT
jgi:hypothetical protein